MTSARICLYKFQLFVDLDINTLHVVFNKLRNFIFSVFIFYFSISFGATKFTSPRASNYLRPALHESELDLPINAASLSRVSCLASNLVRAYFDSLLLLLLLLLILHPFNVLSFLGQPG